MKPTQDERALSEVQNIFLMNQILDKRASNPPARQPADAAKIGRIS